MEEMLKNELMGFMFRLKKIVMMFSTGPDIHMGELTLMQWIEKNSAREDGNELLSEIQSNLHITKPAISQMLNSLEKKGYITREIDKTDRRKTIKKVTPYGLEIMGRMKKDTDETFSRVISGFGEKKTEQLIKLFDEFSDVSENIIEQLIKQKPEQTDAQIDFMSFLRSVKSDGGEALNYRKK